MKKLITALSLCAVSSVSMAALICTGTAGSGTAVASDASGNSFVRTGFTPKCSANTQVDFMQNQTTGAAGAVSTKGNQIFGGHTNGGAVASTGACAANPCTDTEATAAATAKLAEGSS